MDKCLTILRMRNLCQVVACCAKQFSIFAVYSFLALCLSITTSAQESCSETDSTFALRTNLLWDAAAEPNLAFDVRVSDHVTLGFAAGLKPWPRWGFWNWDNSGRNSHWRNFAVVPQARWWPEHVWDGWFVGTDFIYTHYNVGAVRFPFGMYPQVCDFRLQGSFWGGGIFFGHSWWIADNWRIEAEAGLAAGLAAYDRYDCPHCGTRLGREHKAALVPKLGLNIVWHPKKNKDDKKTNK